MKSRSLAFVSYTGFDSVEMKERTGVNAVAERSILTLRENAEEKSIMSTGPM